MGLSIYSLLEAGLLVINAIAILHEERFLNKIGWGRYQANQNQDHYGNMAGQRGLKDNLLELIHSIRKIARVPLILINTIVILYKIFIG